MSGHTPGPWKVEGAKQEGLSVRADHYGVVCNIPGYGVGAREANARLIAAAPELLEALESYRLAKDMSSYGDYAEIAYEQPLRTFDASYGGGDCAKHGRYYGRCHCCSDEWDRLKKQSDRDAVHARDNALRVADDLARAAIAKAKGEA